MFNIANEFTEEHLNEWIKNNKESLNLVDNETYYTLEVTDHTLFDNNSQLKLNNLPTFNANSKEEIFTKMYDYCLNNLKWKDSTIVNIINYPYNFNHALISNNIIKEIDGYYYTRDFSKIGQGDFTLEEYGYVIKLSKDNIHLIDDAVISLVFDFMNHDFPKYNFKMQKHSVC